MTRAAGLRIIAFESSRRLSLDFRARRTLWTTNEYSDVEQIDDYYRSCAGLKPSGKKSKGR